MFVIHHTDLPPEIRREPVRSVRAGKLTKVIYERAHNNKMLGQFMIEYTDDRIIVRQCDPGIKP